MADANQVRKDVLKLVFENQTSHIGSNFSVIDMAVILYNNKKPEDVVIWSPGWKAATACVLEGKEFTPMLETGSMGHGLPIAVGRAIAKKRAGEDGMVYCIMSDGEMNEGTTWESAALAAHHKLDNLTVLIDNNGWQAMGRTKDVVDFKELIAKWHSFNWLTWRIQPEHARGTLESALMEKRGQYLHEKLGDDDFYSKVIIVDTIKGKGVSFMEDNNLYHYKQLTKDEYERALRELA